MRKTDVCIIGGFGHVGLPLGIALASVGLRVSLYDTNVALRPVIRKGTMPFLEKGAGPLLKKTIGKTLFVSETIDDAAHADCIVVTIGVPVDEHVSPEMKPLLALADVLEPHLRRGQCVILRSTLFPGATRFFRDYLTSKGKDIHVAYCPERIVQGRALIEFRTLPQIVSGFSPKARSMAKRVFRALGTTVIELEPEEAEFAKLFSNSWRYITFAAANRFFMLATEHGIDYRRVYRAMTDGYERCKDLPVPGFAAGPCLFKDTLQLSAASRGTFDIGDAAMAVNESLPAFLVGELSKQRDLRGTTVGILGMAYKADIDDTRDSLSFKLKKLLELRGASVLCSDEYVRHEHFVSSRTLVKDAETIIVGVPHAAYRKLKIPKMKNVIDIWNILPS